MDNGFWFSVVFNLDTKFNSENFNKGMYQSFLLTNPPGPCNAIQFVWANSPQNDSKFEATGFGCAIL